MKTVFSDLNAGQSSAVSQIDGPTLIIAGPGSGKTLTLVRRTMNIIYHEYAKPEEVVLCTFTEKAALELRDRVRKTARDIGFQGDLSGLQVGTIHGLSNDYVEKYRHSTRLAANYEVLDDLTQKLFLFEHFDEIIPEPRDGKYFGQWSSKWECIKRVLPFFDKITEELLDPQMIIQDDDAQRREMGEAYIRYENSLNDFNKIDFAHLQKIFVELLNDETVGPQIKSGVKYVMVDEFQDTNFVQEQIVNLLSSSTKNLCVVGDEDQSLYRFRGATVRNILEFEETHPGCRSIELTVNYRSHEKIINAYNKFMSAHDWVNKDGKDFRFDKEIIPATPGEYPNYPAVVSIWGLNEEEEAERFAHLVEFLKRNDVIEDYSQVALLLNSVRDKNSQHYIEALESRGIKSFCPRARNYFKNDEVRVVVSALAMILGYYGDKRGTNLTGALKILNEYIDECHQFVLQTYGPASNLAETIQRLAKEVSQVDEKRSLDRRVADFLFELLGTEPFTSWATNENRARNLATFSQLAAVFQQYYGYTVITAKNINSLRMNFFNSYLRFLFEGGINEYEDKDSPFPKGHVQIMTIHQSKGLEFPVVAVGSLGKNISVGKQVDEVLGKFYSKPPFEPKNRITGFDNMRLHYVAFSRPQKLLVLTHGKKTQPKDHFAPIWNGLPQWPNVEPELISVEHWEYEEKLAPKKSYSFTGDLKVYETCPRQYQMFREFEFAPARTVMIFFGLLVHQTIEDIHRMQLDGKGNEVNEDFIRTRFEFNYRHLLLIENRQIGKEQKEAAFDQVKRYWQLNKDMISRVVETEVDVTLEKDNFILNGAIDLVLSDDDSLDVLDFKAQTRPSPDSPMVSTYYKQLCIYAHILEERQGRRPSRLIVYWTAEKTKEDAMMIFPYNPEDVQNAVQHFEEVVGEIQAQNFKVENPPEAKVCNECDFRRLCHSDGTIKMKAS